MQRGEKRRRSRDDDARSHRVHYEGGERALPVRRPRVSYADIDRTDPRDAFRIDPPEDCSNRNPKHSRAHSRSPLRGSRFNKGGRNVGRGYYDDWRREVPDRFVGNRDRRYSRNNNRLGELPVGDRANDEKAPGCRPILASVNGQISIGRDRNFNNHTKEQIEPALELEEPVDEAKLIEERRKKRAAIKAKYHAQNTPILTAVLGVQEAPVVSVGDSLAMNSPATPRSPRDSATGTIFTIAKDVTDHEPKAGDEPSAADYDPTMDMKDDQKRNEQHAQKLDIPSVEFKELDSTGRNILMREADSQPTAHKRLIADADDFDMFAEGDDEDMFAAPAPSEKVRQTASRAVPIFEAKQLDASLLDNWDDEEGYYKMIPGELLDGRYKVQMSLGKGMFSGVVRAFDMAAKKDLAIKIIRNNETMKKAGLKEIEILKKIRAADPDDKKHVIRLERSFEHKGHLCIVFESLNINLRDVLKKSGIRDVGISLKAVRAYAQQMFLGLSLLRKCNILHADLKPDNVLVSENQNLLKICDLGSASDASENDITQYLVSRFYRAPEIILGMPYDFAIDMWSIGCTLYELYTGKILFPGRTNNQMLRNMMECRGKFSNKLLRKGQFTVLHFDEMGNFRSIEKDKITGKDIVRTMNINKPTRELKQRLLSAACGSESEIKELNLFVDLLEKCLTLNHEKRCTPDEALKHPFIRRTATATK